MHGEAQLLTPPHNYAVVQLPTRKYPGVVFQGDSLHCLIRDLREAWREPDPDEREELFEMVMEHLLAVQRGYEAALVQAGLDLQHWSR